MNRESYKKSFHMDFNKESTTLFISIYAQKNPVKALQLL